MDTEFRVGDHVKILYNPGSSLKDLEGIVRKILGNGNPDIGVEITKGFTEGHKLGGLLTKDNGWYFYAKQLVLIKRGTPEITISIKREKTLR